MDDDPLTSPSFPAINASDSRSYRSRRSSGAHSVPQVGPPTGPQPAAGRSGGFADPTTQYPVQAHEGQPPAPVANPYGSYVNASQPAYQEVPGHRGDYGNGQQPDGAWYNGVATGYLPPNGNGHNGNGHNGNGHNGNGQGYPAPGLQNLPGGYGTIDYQIPPYPGEEYEPAPSQVSGYAPRHQPAGQFDESGYGAPNPAYGQDGYQDYPDYPGYGPGSR